MLKGNRILCFVRINIHATQRTGEEGTNTDRCHFCPSCDAYIYITMVCKRGCVGAGFSLSTRKQCLYRLACIEVSINFQALRMLILISQVDT